MYSRLLYIVSIFTWGEAIVFLFGGLSQGVYYDIPQVRPSPFRKGVISLKYQGIAQQSVRGIRVRLRVMVRVRVRVMG